ncbi:transporter substrate-binding domain-containing protein [Massilia sp. TS11]|uniref:transporter substrate-binding domain-containing protein n=1 Tax=Massilia sp. TS11 TaxID=2908003 RepID=UPI001EDA5F36|nr:transporter substrate-binding domain-containing protein [Massilia sp. TS11]MCG2585447.1 transporter substrate-binding domain-containing protein [Massilia sp. TS11]
MNRLRRLLLAALAAAPAAAAAVRRVHYPAQDLDNRANRYPLQLLRAALARAGAHYQLAPVQRMQQGRALAEIGSARGPDVIWSATSQARERSLLPIRIPLYKGLIGWRLLLVRKDDLARFASLAPAQLRGLRCASGHDWPDTDILEQGGLQVARVRGTDSILRLLEDGHIDFFPRSAVEIWDEAAAHPRLAVAPRLAIHYPLASYFFVHRDGERLASDLRTGLEALLQDGSFDKLFQENFGELLKQARLQERQILELNNPDLPPQTPLARRALWL